MGLGNSEPPPPAERRPSARKRVLLAGIITFNNGVHSFDCTFRNLSETGALIAVGTNTHFPTVFYLINIRDRIAYEAKVVRNIGKEVGVTFQTVLPLSTITDSSLGYLKKLWLAKATG